MKKFDVVIMNPPYQEQNDKGGGTTNASPLYHFFIEKVIDELSPDYLISINPSRWMIGGRGLDKFRDRMKTDKRIKKIVHFPGGREVFQDVFIRGGVSYFLWDKNYNGECEFVAKGISIKRSLNEFDIILQDNQAISILKKVVSATALWMNKEWAIQTPFGVVSSFKDWSNSGTSCYSVGTKINFIALNVFTDKFKIKNKWKVATSKACNLDSSGVMAIATNFFIIEPKAICTQTYIIVNVFENKKEAENFITYTHTKFFRFMLGLRTLTQDINKEKFAWVPDLGDYTKPWTDAELYDKFNLTEQERGYIGSKIKTLAKVDKNDI